MATAEKLIASVVAAMETASAGDETMNDWRGIGIANWENNWFSFFGGNQKRSGSRRRQRVTKEPVCTSLRKSESQQI